VTPDVYARLTDAQIEDVYAHPRDGNGRLKAPAARRHAASLAEELARAEATMSAFGVTTIQRERALARIREAHAGR